MQLIFAYIKKQGCLREIGFNFSPFFHIDYSGENQTLNIERNDCFPTDFFLYPIANITGIVGENGSGKTTLIYWLLKSFIDGSGDHHPDGIVVLEDNSGRLMIYRGPSFRNVRKSHPVNLHVEFAREDEDRERWFTYKTPICYYSGHFVPLLTHDVDSAEYSGETNISDKWLLIKDIANYANVDGLYLSRRLGEYLNAHISQNAQRIVKLLANERVREQLTEKLDFNLPQYIVLVPNRSGRSRLQAMSKDELDRIVPFNFTQEVTVYKSKYPQKPEDELLNTFIVEAYVNYLTENLPVGEHIIKALTRWKNAEPTEAGVLEDFKKFAAAIEKIDDYLTPYLLKVIENISEITETFDSALGPKLYIKVADSDKMRRLDEMLGWSVFLTSRFFDTHYYVDLDSLAKLSSGELELLNLLSRLYWHLNKDTEDYANKRRANMLLLDEAEIGFHPEWQRKYLDILITFLGIFASNLKEETGKEMNPFQIIFTTHSPICLSDLPKECINFLEKKEGRVVNSSDKMPQTFGQNVFELYRHSFFMQNGLMGMRAQRFISDILSEIRQLGKEADDMANVAPAEPSLENLRRRIALIGDANIRSYLSHQLALFDIDAAIEEKQRELKVLMESRERQKGGRV